MSKLTLKMMYEAINSLDLNNQLKSISYNYTNRNKLSTTIKSPWWCFIPYGNWQNAQNTTPPVPSPFQSAIKAAIAEGFSNPAENNYYIDLLHLGGEPDAQFFDDPGDKVTIIDQLAQLINGLPTDATVTIRYLDGNPPNSDLDPANNSVLKAFFPDQSPFTRPNVSFYYGAYNPEIDWENNAEIKAFITSFVKWLFNSLCEKYPLVCNFLISIETILLKKVLDIFSINKLVPLSWNHSKIVALNGRQLVAGGANFWNEYQSGSTGPFDMAMSVTGDAASDAHSFANYLWNYLRTKPITDNNSCCKVNILGNSINDFSDTTQPAIFPLSTENTGSQSILSVGRNGDFPPQDLGYPQQVIDAIRDFVINMFAAIIESYGQRANIPDFTAGLVELLSDDNLSKSVFKEEGINSTAWASRYARNYAIKNATSSLKISQQKFVLDDLLSVHDYQKFLHSFNLYFGSNWDGVIWPFDLLVSLGYALANISETYKTGQQVEIVSSFYGDAHLGYEDPVTAAEFSKKLINIMTAMKDLGYIKPNRPVADIVNSLLFYKRVPQSEGNNIGNHCKFVMIDDAICYIGSDNAYPSYNTEFGLWMDDTESIKHFLAEYWTDLWKNASNGEPE